jgi:hypothetical protein
MAEISASISGILHPDIINKSLAYLHLREFQILNKNNELNYADRYFLKYASKYPYVPMVTFESKEHEYLFYAAWFHGEVGYNSHLFFPVNRCLTSAIKQNDPILVKYFRDRTKSIENNDFLELAIELGNLEIVQFLLSDITIKTINVNIKITYVEIANLLLKHLGNHEDILIPIYRDIPIDKLQFLKTIKLTSPYIMHGLNVKIINGLLLSENPDKIKLAREQILGILSRKHDGYVINVLDYENTLFKEFELICQLNDPEVLIKHWPRFREYITSNKIKKKYLIILIKTTSTECLKTILRIESKDFFNGLNLETNRRVSVVDINNKTIKSRIRDMLELIDNSLSEYKDTILVQILAAYIGDERLLKYDELSEEVTSILGYCDHLELLIKYIITAPDSDKFIIEVDTNNFDTIMKSNIPSENISINSDINLSYTQWETLIQLIITNQIEKDTEHITGIMNSLPTIYLDSLLRTSKKYDKISGKTFITLPITNKSFIKAIEKNNIEYVEYASKSKFFKLPTKLELKPNRISENMKILLKTLNITYTFLEDE